MLKRLAVFDDEANRSILAYGAIVMCFVSMLTGSLAVRSHREALMMQTMSSLPATVLALEKVKTGFSAKIAFMRTEDGILLECQIQVGLNRDGDHLHTGSVVYVIPRSDSCGEPVVVGPRNTTVLASASGAFFLSSLVLGVLAAQSMLRSRRTGARE